MIHLLKGSDGHMPRTQAEYDNFVACTVQYLRIMRPGVFSRTFHSQEVNITEHVSTYVVDGRHLPEDPAEVLPILQAELAKVQQRVWNSGSPTVYHTNVAPNGEEREPDGQTIVVHLTEAEGEETAPEDLSEVSSQSGMGSPVAEIGDEENFEAKTALLA